MSSIRLFAAATVAGDVLLLVLLVVLAGALVHRRTRPAAPVVRWAARLGKIALPFAAVVAVASTLGSLYLSEVEQLAPCLLCWWQRVFMYPQAIILGLGAWRRDRAASFYSLWLSVIGAAIAVYHIGLQTGLGLTAPCGGGDLVSCTTVQVLEFGYVTIPVMSLTGFGLLVVLAIFSLVRWPSGAATAASSASAPSQPAPARAN